MNDVEDNSKMLAELRANQQRIRAKLAHIEGNEDVDDHDREQRRETKASGACRARAATVVKIRGMMALDAAPAPSQQSSYVSGMSNEQVVHELLLDPDFRVGDKAAMPEDKLVHIRIRETFERAFWESLVDDMSATPPVHNRVLSVLNEISTEVQSLSQGYPESQRIRDIIDIDLITQQLKNDTLDYKGCECLIDSIIHVSTHHLCLLRAR